MTKDEFDKISGAVCDPEMFEMEVNPTYMTFAAVTKKEIAVMYWGQRPGAYDLWLRARTLAKELRVGFENDAMLDKWLGRKARFIFDLKNMQIN